MSNPVRLHKKEETITIKVLCFIDSHSNIFLIISVIVLMILLIVLAYNIVGLAAVESGMLRNFIAGGV